MHAPTYITPIVTSTLALWGQTCLALESRHHDGGLILIRIASLKDEDSDGRVFRQSVGDRQTSGTTSNNDIVEDVVGRQWNVQTSCSSLDC